LKNVKLRLAPQK